MTRQPFLSMPSAFKKVKTDILFCLRTSEAIERPSANNPLSLEPDWPVMLDTMTSFESILGKLLSALFQVDSLHNDVM